MTKNAGECRRLYNATQTLTDSVCVVVLNPFVSIATIGLYNYILVHEYNVLSYGQVLWKYWLKKKNTLECMHVTNIGKKESTDIYMIHLHVFNLFLKIILKFLFLVYLKQYIYIHVCICVCVSLSSFSIGSEVFFLHLCLCLTILTKNDEC